MGKEQHPRMVTFEWFAILSMPLDMALLGSADLLQLLSHLHHTCRSFRYWICFPHVAFQEASPIFTTIYIMLHSFIASVFITCNNTFQFVSNYMLVFSNFLICFLPLDINYYLHVATNTLFLQVLPNSMPHYIMFKKNATITS